MSQEQIHHTSSPEGTHPLPESWILTTIKNQAITILMAIVFGLYAFVWNSHDSEKDISYRMATTEKNVEKLFAADKEQTETQNQFLIGLTKISEAQSRMAQDIKDIQGQQQKNTEMLMNRK